MLCDDAVLPSCGTWLALLTSCGTRGTMIPYSRCLCLFPGANNKEQMLNDFLYMYTPTRTGALYELVPQDKKYCKSQVGDFPYVSRRDQTNVSPVYSNHEILRN